MIFCPDDCEVNSRKTAFMLQSHLTAMCACLHLIGQNLTRWRHVALQQKLSQIKYFVRWPGFLLMDPCELVPAIRWRIGSIQMNEAVAFFQAGLKSVWMRPSCGNEALAHTPSSTMFDIYKIEACVAYTRLYKSGENKTCAYLCLSYSREPTRHTQEFYAN